MKRFHFFCKASWSGLRILFYAGIVGVLLFLPLYNKVGIPNEVYGQEDTQLETSLQGEAAPSDIGEEKQGSSRPVDVDPAVTKTKVKSPKLSRSLSIIKRGLKKSRPAGKIIIPKTRIKKPESSYKTIKKETGIEKSPTSLKVAIKMLNESREKARVLEEQAAILKQELKEALENLAKARAKAEEDRLRIKELQEALANVSKSTEVYIVKKDECLWKIAAKEEVYGDPSKWLWLYHANRDQIYDPNLIFPDMVLIVPRFKENRDTIKTLQGEQE